MTLPLNPKPVSPLVRASDEEERFMNETPLPSKAVTPQTQKTLSESSLQEQIADAKGAFDRIRAIVGATNDDPMPCEHYVAIRLAELQADKARLDWLHIHARWNDEERRLTIIFPMPMVTFLTLRDTIDAAIRASVPSSDAGAKD